MTDEIEALVGRLNALAGDCDDTDGFEDAAPDVRTAADALTSLSLRVKELEEGLQRASDMLAATSYRDAARALLSEKPA